jgi:glycine betaine/proline transport system substrate-binding protein
VKRLVRSAALLVICALAVAGCSNSGDSGSGTSDSTGDVVVKPARATWSTGYFQAAIYTQLLRDLGYNSTDASTNEVSPDLFYPAVALREFDYWANGWFPGADPTLATPLAIGGTVGDYVSPIGNEVRSGAVQGFLIDKATADKHSITSLRQIVESEKLRGLFDADEDGAADIFGCDKGWNCGDATNEIISINGWQDRLNQIQDSYDALFSDVQRRIDKGRPTLYYTWTPNYTSAVLVPGRDVVWLNLLGDAPPGQGEPTTVPPGACTSDPCFTGYSPSDIKVAANNEFLQQHPDIAALFEVVQIPIDDISQQNLAMFRGADTQSDIDGAAQKWIADHREQVDSWLASAREQGNQ